MRDYLLLPGADPYDPSAVDLDVAALCVVPSYADLDVAALCRPIIFASSGSTSA